MLGSLELFNSSIEVVNFNNDFLLLRSEESSLLAKIGKALFQRKFEFVDEVIVTEMEICLKLNAHFTPSKIELLNQIEQHQSTAPCTYKLPIYFDVHEDWEQVQRVTGFQKEEIISKLIALDFSIAMFGFLPGFLYLSGLNPSLHVPRKRVPSKYVSANSLAIGGRYLGLYSLDSPGGWHVIGKTPLSLLEMQELPPLALNLGDKIKLHAIDKSEYEHLLQQQLSLKAYAKP